MSAATWVYGSFIFFSVATLIGISAVVLLFWGALSELLLATGNMRSTELAKLTLARRDMRGPANARS